MPSSTGGCVVTWSVSGASNDGRYNHVFAGSGQKTLVFKDAQGTLMRAGFWGDTESGATVRFDVDVPLSYTETVTEIATGQETKNSGAIPIDGVRVEGIPLDSTLTMQSDSQHVVSNFADWSWFITWSDTAPSPPFDRDKYRR